MSSMWVNTMTALILRQSPIRSYKMWKESCFARASQEIHPRASFSLVKKKN